MTTTTTNPNVTTVRIPTPLRPLTQGQAEVQLPGNTVGDVLTNLGERASGLRERLYSDSGELRRFVNVYLNQDDIRTLDGLTTPVKNGDVLSIVPAIAGGATN
ncbi:MAG: ubiquitin-like small modifier protein 1 [Planctomycetota bacterium]